MAAEALDPNVAVNLALAVIASSQAPLVLLDEDLTIVAASNSFCQTFQINSDNIHDFKIHELGRGEWDRPQLRSLLQAVARGLLEPPSYEMDLERDGRETRRVVISVRKLEYGDEAHPRLILTVVDVTEARIADKLKDDLLREKSVLLQEVQHRVANSLQIIASVLLHSARQVQSDEIRSHLHDAHHRVMSVAAMQKQLAASRLGDVALRAYLTQLCESIGASMIHDHSQLSLAVTTDESVVKADISVSLGLIVTELVINSLKHAFPDHRPGKIRVDYNAHGSHWTLAVSDNGIGILSGGGSGKPGLGTSIVEALARQLNAEINVTDANPGTLVSIAHLHGPALGGASSDRAV